MTRDRPTGGPPSLAKPQAASPSNDYDVVNRSVMARKKEAGKSKPSVRASRKLIAFDTDTMRALTLLARDRMMDFQELADEAFRDLLKKHRRPVTLKESLKQSVRTPDND